MPHLSVMPWAIPTSSSPPPPRSPVPDAGDHVVRLRRCRHTGPQGHRRRGGAGRRPRAAVRALQPGGRGDPARPPGRRGGVGQTPHRARAGRHRSRVALESDTSTRRSSPPLTRYQSINHLGSRSLETDRHRPVDQIRGVPPVRHHCVPSGRQVDRRLPPKRSRYTGMERDDESGLEYHQATVLRPVARAVDVTRPARRSAGRQPVRVREEQPRRATGTATGSTRSPCTAPRPTGWRSRPGSPRRTPADRYRHGRRERERRPTRATTSGRCRRRSAGADRRVPLPVPGEGAGRHPLRHRRRQDLEQFGRHLRQLEDVGFVDAPVKHTQREGARPADQGRGAGTSALHDRGREPAGTGARRRQGALALGISGAARTGPGGTAATAGVRRAHHQRPCRPPTGSAPCSRTSRRFSLARALQLRHRTVPCSAPSRGVLGITSLSPGPGRHPVTPRRAHRLGRPLGGDGRPSRRARRRRTDPGRPLLRAAARRAAE